MSNIKMDTIWQHDKVLPYLFGDLKNKIESICPIDKIYVFGSRARIPVDDWHKLEGKDWDILIITKFKIVNTSIWTHDLNYYIDLKITGPKGMDNFTKYNRPLIELYPVFTLQLDFQNTPDTQQSLISDKI